MTLQTSMIIACALIGGGVLWLLSCGKPLTIDGELAKAPASDRQALEAVLDGTGIALAQLTPVGAGVARGFGVLQHHERAVAVEDGRIVELRLSGVPLPHADALTRLTGLQALWLSDNQLTALPDLSALKGLVSLHINQNQLKDIRFLAGLQALTDLDLSGNRIEDLKPLAALPALKTIDLRGNPAPSLPDPQPAHWVLKTDANPTGGPPPPERPPNWVKDLPPRKGKAGKGTSAGSVNSGSYTVKGTIGVLNGAIDQYNIPGGGPSGAGGSTVEISVEKGRVRAYLESQGGYVFAEAAPGKPGHAQGILPPFAGGTCNLVVEAVDGEAQGISYRIYR